MNPRATNNSGRRSPLFLGAIGDSFGTKKQDGYLTANKGTHFLTHDEHLAVLALIKQGHKDAKKRAGKKPGSPPKSRAQARASKTDGK